MGPIEEEPLYETQDRVEELTPDEVQTAPVDSPYEPAFQKNAVIIPEAKPRGIHCPLCGGTEYTGRNLQGLIEMTCLNKECRNKWHGGLPMVPEDPRRPAAAFYTPPPPLSIEKNPRTGRFMEVHRPVDTTPDFRRGLKVPSGEE